MTAPHPRAAPVPQPGTDIPEALSHTPARCTVLEACGCCPWQAVPYATQLERKRAALLAALAAQPDLAGIEVAPVTPCPTPFGFRTKIQMAVGGRKGALELGFYRPGTKVLVPIPRCVIQDDLGERVVAAARDVLNRAGIEPYDEARHEGLLRTLLVRVCPRGQQAYVTLVCRTERISGRDRLAEALLAIPGVCGVALNVQNARSNTVLGRETLHLAGRERLLLDVAGLRFLLSPTAFFQTSLFGAEALVEKLRAALPGPYGTLLDLYGGVGLFARTLADRCERAILVEASAQAIEDAAAALDLRPRKGEAPPRAALELAALTAERFVEVHREPVDVAVVDPPRKGLDPGVLDALARRLVPQRIAYVSCNPEALVRDLLRFAGHGYRAGLLEPVDLFPHTDHLEVVTVLERERSDARSPLERPSAAAMSTSRPRNTSRDPSRRAGKNRRKP